MSLPGYPFAAESYPVAETYFNSSVSVGLSVVLPLSERAQSDLAWRHVSVNESAQSSLAWRNVSDFDGLHFVATLSGEEFFVQDHRLGTRRILPGVVYLEAARAAVALATHMRVASLEDVTWEAPIECAESPVDIHITLSRGEAGEICYEIFTEHCTTNFIASKNFESNNSESNNSGSNSSSTDRSDLSRRIHSRGVARLLTQPSITTTQASDASSLNLQGLIEMTQLNHPSLEECAAAFDAQGIHYGPSLRAIEVLRIGEGQVLARLALPANVRKTHADFLLHPSLMDCALQCAMALTLMSRDPVRAQVPSLPFALEHLEIRVSLPETVWVWVRRAQGSTEASAVQRLDLDWLDETGRILVRMCGFSSRQPLVSSAVVEDAHALTGSLESEVPKQAVLYAPVWNLSDLERPIEAELSGNARVLVVGGNKASRAQIYAQYPNARHLDFRPKVAGGPLELRLSQSFEHIVWIAPEPETEDTEEEQFASQEDCVLHLFALIQALHSVNYTLQELSWTVLTRQAVAFDAFALVNPAHAAVHGLVGSMAKEFPHWRVRLLDLDIAQTWPVAELFARPFDTDGDVQILRDGKWFRRSLTPVTLPQSASSPYRHSGVYLVIGGAGGLGEVWSRYLIQNYAAQIIWIGRRPLDQNLQSKIDALSAFGPAPLYLQADGAEPRALERVVQEIKSRYHHLHGVVHSALVLRDKSLTSMSAEDFREGLRPKLDLSVRLAQVLSGQKLDFILFFSSLQSFSQAPGQSNYAAGSTFLDSFAHQLALQNKCLVKVMNWGYWGSVGIVTAEHYRERMTKAGLGSIEPQEGMDGLNCLLASPFRQLAMFKTTSVAAPSLSQQALEPLTLYPALIPANLGMFES
jgi:polyketide synthase PksN